MKLRILLCGSGGQLGREIQLAAIEAHGALDITTLDRIALDITKREAVQGALSTHRPSLLINTAAYTDVDRAESEPEQALSVNRDGAGHLAMACAGAGIPLIHVSTDYVFDGRSRHPYQEMDPVSPLNVYGRTKAEGEARIRASLREHIIIRTSWLFAPHGRNFLTTMIRLGRERETLSIVNDQVGCPTFAGDLAHAILQIATSLISSDSPWGTFHICNTGEATWYGLARAIFDLAPPTLGICVKNLTPIHTEDFPTAAERPRYSVLDCRKVDEIFGIELPPWRSGVERALKAFHPPRN